MVIKRPMDAVPFDPMDGCPQCEWVKDNLGTHLFKTCHLHEKIDDLKNDLLMQKQITDSLNRMLSDVGKIIGFDAEDNPLDVARERMDEIRTLEEELDEVRLAKEQPHQWRIMAFAPKDRVILVAGGTYHYKGSKPSIYDAGLGTRSVKWDGEGWQHQTIGQRYDDPKWWIDPLPPIPENNDEQQHQTRDGLA